MKKQTNLYAYLTAILIFGIGFSAKAMEKKVKSDPALGKELVVAIKKANTTLVQKLINAGADLNYEHDILETPLIAALEMTEKDESNIDLVKILLDAGADANREDRHGMTPLTFAVTFIHPSEGSQLKREILKILLDKGANPNQRSMDGRTPLIQAALENDSIGVEVLLAAGADPYLVDDEGKTALRNSAVNPLREKPETWQAIIKAMLEPTEQQLKEIRERVYTLIASMQRLQISRDIRTLMAQTLFNAEKQEARGKNMERIIKEIKKLSHPDTQKIMLDYLNSCI